MPYESADPPAQARAETAAMPDASAPAPDLLNLLDDPQEWASFGRPLGAGQSTDVPPQDIPVWESHLVLQGMHCAACALTIEAALRAVPGVEQAEVSAAAQRARVVWRSAQTRPSLWVAAVLAVGYGALPARDALARELRQAERRRMLWRWLVAGFCMMQVMMYAWPAYVAQPGDLSQEMETLLRWASWVISLPVVLFACGPFFASAWRDLRTRQISMDLPVALGMLITFVVSTLGTFDPGGIFGREVFFDSLTMFVFFLLTGRWLELRLRDRTAGALEAVMNRLPDSVLRRTADGSYERVVVRRLQVADVLRVLPGEAFPADGVIVSGRTQVDEALLTGESTPLARGVGESVVAGSYNLAAAVEVQVQQLGAHTRFAQIVALMESAALQKPRLAQLADRVARPFLVLVLLAAVAAAAWWWPSDPGHALMVAVAILIVTCPCALSLATPVAMLTAAGTLARQGVLVRNLQALESLAGVDRLVFDKTGTLTQDGLQVHAVQAGAGWSVADALALAAVVAAQSIHPVARAVAAHAHAQRQLGQGHGGCWQLEAVHEHGGLGLEALVRPQAVGASQAPGLRLRLGSARFTDAEETGASQVVLALEQGGHWVPLLRMALSETLRPEARAVVAALQSEGVQVQLLSGDRAEAVQRIAGQAGIAVARAECSPQDKLVALQQLQAAGHQVAMVGDGLNDGPVLAGAHASFAFGRSVPLAQARSDVVVLGERLDLVLATVHLARRTLRVVRQNLAWAAAYNAVSVPLAVLGWMPAWLAGLGMALSSLLVVLNAARLARLDAPPPASAGTAQPNGAWAQVQPLMSRSGPGPQAVE